MVPRKMPALPPLAGGAVDDILTGPVVVIGVLIPDLAAVVAEVDQVKIGGGDMKGGIPQIPGDGKRLKEHLRPDHGGAEVEEHTPVQL